MAEYITNHKGQEYIVSWTKGTPTKEQLIQKIEKHVNMTAEDTAKGLTASAVQGLTFGSGGTVAGLANIAATPPMKLAGKIMKEEVPETTISEQFEAGKKAFEEPEKRVSKKYPKASLLAALIGGIPTGGGVASMGIKGGAPLLTKMGRGLVSGSAMGTAYGMGSKSSDLISKMLKGEELTEDVNDLRGSLPVSATVGAGVGAVAPAVMAGGLKVGRGIVDMFRRKGIKEVVKNVPAPEIEASIKGKKSLLETGGIEASDLAQKAKLSHEEARNILVPYARAVTEKQPKTLQAAVNKVLGKKSKVQTVDELQTKYEAEARPMYEQAFGIGGDLSKTDKSISVLTKDKTMAQYIKSARNSAVGRDLKGLPDTHIQVLDASKKKLDDAISSAIRKGEKEEARALMGLKQELLTKIDDIVPEYAAARKISSDRFRLEEAMDNARSLIKTENPEIIARAMNKLSTAEKEAYVVGLRDELIGKISSSAKTKGANVAKNIFGDNENYIIRQRLKEILSAEDYRQIMSVVDPLVRSGDNVAALLGGSQTAEKTVLPSRNRLFVSMMKKGKQMKYPDVARLLTEPDYLAKEYSKEASRAAVVPYFEGLYKNLPGSLSKVAAKKSIADLIREDK